MIGRLRQRVRLGWRVIHTYGFRWTARRLWYDAQRRVGWFLWRNPAWDWHERPLESWLLPGHVFTPLAERSPRFFWDSTDNALRSRLSQLVGDNAEVVISQADAALDGRLRYFSGQEIDIGSLPTWHYDPVYDVHWPHEAHWSRLESLPQNADVKLIWEPARFAVAYLWVRAYWLTADERYPTAFWAWFEDWMAQNPPMRGVHWLDGQECAFRIMAWTFALFGFADSPHTTHERTKRLVLALAAHAERIVANHHYAKLQNQNHAISEAVGLYTVGTLFPELRDAARWRATGRAELLRAARVMIAADGGFIQQSVNYQRLMLDNYLWAMRLADLNGDALPGNFLSLITKSAEMLYQLQDEETGYLPNYGANDGALILPLTTCAYRDYRPTLNAAYFLQNGQRLHNDGPWDELLFWLFGSEALDAPLNGKAYENLRADASGYYTIRGKETFAFIRAHTYKTRPMQSDALHVDLWWRGLNIAQDAGTFSYNAPPPWRRGLAGAEIHNTIIVDGEDHMIRGPRFLWFNWTQAEARFIASTSIEATRIDRRLPGFKHIRTLTLADNNTWQVEDVIHYPGQHTARLHWLLGDWPYQPDGDGGIVLNTPQGNYGLGMTSDQMEIKFDVIRGQADSTRGWVSPTYQVRVPALSAAFEVVFQESCEIRSVFTPYRRPSTLS